MPSQGFPRDWRRHQTKERWRVVIGWRGMGAGRPGDTGSGGVMPLTGRPATCTCNLPPRPGMTRRCEAPSRGRAWQRDTVSRHECQHPPPPRPCEPTRPPPHWPTWALDLSRRYTVERSACLVTPRDTWHHLVTSWQWYWVPSHSDGGCGIQY